MSIYWFQSRLCKKLAEGTGDSLIRNPEVYLCNNTVDVTTRELVFLGKSTSGMRAASRYR